MLPHRSRDRGRSRDISPVALARRASEERRTSPGRASAHHSPRFHQQRLATKASSAPSNPQLDETLVNNKSLPSRDTVATLVPFRQSRPRIGGVFNPSDSFPHASSSSSIPMIRTPSPEDYRSCPSRSLQDQMQEAYALDNMHLARILYLKLRGIEVTSDDDPRIAQVRDEDFCFVPEGALRIDEECEKAIREGEKREKERREKLVKDRKLKERERVWEEEALRLRSEKQRVQRQRAESIATRETQRLDYKSKARPQLELSLPAENSSWRTHSVGSPNARRVAMLTGTVSNLQQHSRASKPDDRFQYEVMRPAASLPETRHFSGSSSSKRLSRPTATRAPASAVSFRDVVTRMEGRLFPVDDTDVVRNQTQMQRELLDTLLTVIDWEVGERRKGKGKEMLSTASSASTTCLACSVGTISTISRSNSWSSDSGSSVSTTITTPPTSPSFDKPPLPALADDPEFRALVHSCHRKNNLIIVPLSQHPLSLQLGDHPHTEVTQLCIGLNDTRQKHGAQPIIRRMRESVSSLLDLATKVQQSYIRTIQFTIPSSPLPPYPSSPPPRTTTRRSTARPLKPEGYRATCSDVCIFASPAANETSFEQVIPLKDSHPEPPPPRMIPPLTIVTPSPLRPRYVPVQPEWRVRPVANPVVLRLRALQNLLFARGMQWEGRAHQGSLGCGREKLTGVAFDGIGRSSLAFETSREAIV
ncbi:hypothetical protein BD410DRAFT_348941 [Rickenella mellea]|uniref:Uncharacterized protein n=1 Tax=Rickenella mellea TaxID=50990 RepID=A0A4Y7QMN1_9AGAM|nr:hypothetical protein BD410DRAFT_348941 [Rickenella mellea]